MNMDEDSDLVEPATPVLACDSVSYWRTEDSGYHTFTPGSNNCSEVSTENIDPTGIRSSICGGKENYHKFYNTPGPCIDYQSNFSENSENIPERPKRRGVKRPYQEDTDANDVSYGSIPTPTSIIAGQIQKLKVNDSANFSGNYSISPLCSEYSDASSIYNFNAYLSFPSTPIKKICKSSCKLNRFKSNHKSSPLRSVDNINHLPKKFARQLDFETHSLSCEPQSLQAVPHPLQSPAGPVLYKPNQKIDLIKLLSKTIKCVPAIEKILSCMSPKDIFNFSLVSPTWHQICEEVPVGRKKLNRYLRLSKENQENKIRSIPKANSDIMKILRDTHNIKEHVQITRSSSNSPPASPRSVRFKMFVRSASLDTRIQLACVRCQQPAKVTKDSSGEIWAECTRVTCAYQFCKHCSCDRHPGKTCIRFDLEGPSPSKRKKKTCAAGSRQSKTNLRRLLIK